MQIEIDPKSKYAYLQFYKIPLPRKSMQIKRIISPPGPFQKPIVAKSNISNLQRSSQDRNKNIQQSKDDI